jgi:hypothetical protein
MEVLMKCGKKRSKERSAAGSRGVRPNHVGLSTLEEHRLRRSLRRKACSEPWVEAQIKTVYDSSSDGESIRYRFFDSSVFPPGGQKETAMRWCRFCGRFTPANCIHLIEHSARRGGQVHSTTLQCDDCRLGIEVEIFRELYEAGLFLRPTGSMSFVRMRERLGERMKG